MRAKDIRDRVLRESDINVFDVFAMLYSYCAPRFGKGGLDPELRYGRILKEAAVIGKDVLPSPRRLHNPLTPECKAILAAAIDCGGDEQELGVRLYKFLKAIDIASSGMSARSMNIASFSSMSQQLNVDRELGLVYPKSAGPLTHLTRKGGKDLRTGEDKGDYLRHNIENLVCVKTSDECDLDFGVMDVSGRLGFPSEAADCRVAFIPLIDEIGKARIGFRDSGDARVKLFHFDGLSNEEEVAERAVFLMQRAHDLGATVVVFPELCVPEAVRTAISEGLSANLFPSVKMVVAGSFHEGSGGNWGNVAHVLGADGRELWQQRKLQRFTLMKYEAERVPSLGGMCGGNSREDIGTVPRLLKVRDTPLGRTAILICSDFLLRGDPHWKMVIDMGVNFVVVPAMSVGLPKDFESAAEELAIHCKAVSVVCNCCALAREAARAKKSKKPTCMSFAYRPWHEPMWELKCKPRAGSSGPCSSRACSEEFTVDLANWPKRARKIALED